MADGVNPIGAMGRCFIEREVNCEQCKESLATLQCTGCLMNEEPFYYCQSCSDLIHLGNKKCQHPLSQLVNITQIQHKLQETVETIEKLSEKTQDKYKEIEREMNEEEENCDNMSAECLYVFNELRTFMNSKEKELLAHCESIKAHNREKRQGKLEEFRQQMERLESAGEELKSVLSQTDSEDFNEKLLLLTDKTTSFELTDEKLSLSTWKDSSLKKLTFLPDSTFIKDALLRYTIPSVSDWSEGDTIYVTAPSVNISPDGSFWVLEQLSSNEIFNELSLLSESLSSMISSVRMKTTTKWSVGDLCAAFYPKDQCWHRALIEKMYSDSRGEWILVHYVDFGNTCELYTGLVTPLPDKFKSYPFKCKKCKFAFCDGETVSWAALREPRWKYTDLVKEQVLTVTVVEKYIIEGSFFPLYSVHLFNQALSVDVGQEVMKQISTASNVKSKEIIQPPLIHKDPPHVPNSEPTPPPSNTLQPDHLPQDITDKPPDKPPSPSSTTQTDVTDEEPYLTKIEDEVIDGVNVVTMIADDEVHVIITDNGDVIKPEISLSSIDDNDQPTTTPPIDETNPDANTNVMLIVEKCAHDRILSVTEESSIASTITSPNLSENIVGDNVRADSNTEQESEYENKTEKLSEREATPHNLPKLSLEILPPVEETNVDYTLVPSLHPLVEVGSALKVVVNSPLTVEGMFWCQLALDEIEMTLYNTLFENIQSHALTKSGLYTPVFFSPNDLCMGIYYDDSQWYRGCIESIEDDKYLSVRFVDYGNLEILELTDVLSLKSDFRRLPFQAIQCNLCNNEKVSFSEEECQVFDEMFLDSEPEELAIISVVSIHEKVVSVVMEINGSNVIDQLSSNQKSSKLRSYSFDMPPQEDNTEGLSWAERMDIDSPSASHTDVFIPTSSSDAVTTVNKDDEKPANEVVKKENNKRERKSSSSKNNKKGFSNNKPIGGAHDKTRPAFNTSGIVKYLSKDDQQVNSRWNKDRNKKSSTDRQSRQEQLSPDQSIARTSSLPPSSPRIQSLYVKNIPPSYTCSKVSEGFRPYGYVYDVRKITNRSHQVIYFVDMDEAGAREAINKLSGVTVPSGTQGLYIQKDCGYYRNYPPNRKE